MLIIILTTALTTNEYVVAHVNLYVGILAACNNASNGVIYLCRSKQYRDVFLSVFFRGGNEVRVLSEGTTTRTRH